MKHFYIPSISSKYSTVLQAYNNTYSQNTSPQNLYTILIWIICRGLDSCGVFASFSSHKDFLLYDSKSSSTVSYYILFVFKPEVELGLNDLKWHCSTFG